jgi:hypothetical protein
VGESIVVKKLTNDDASTSIIPPRSKSIIQGLKEKTRLLRGMYQSSHRKGDSLCHTWC